jgi:hypothetical protein
MPTRYLDDQNQRNPDTELHLYLKMFQADTGSILEARNVGFGLEQALPVLSTR